jgi:hypothetical protein
VDIYITLAVEDPLGKAIARKMLFQSDNNYSVVNCLGGKGYGYLKAKIGPNYNSRLSEFVRNNWDVFEAVKYSESFNRAFHKVQEFRLIKNSN